MDENKTILHHKSLRILLALTPLEFKKLISFANSSYFNSNIKSSIETISHVSNLLNNEGKISRTNIMNEFKTNNYSTINNALWKIFPLLEKFLIQLGLERDWKYKFEYLCSELEERNLDDIMENIIKNSEKNILKISEFSPYNYYLMLVLTNCRYNTISKNVALKSSKKYKRIFEIQNKLSEYLTLYFLILTVKDYTNYCWQRRSYQPDEEYGFSNIKLLKSHPEIDKHLLSILSEIKPKQLKIIFKIYFGIFLIRDISYSNRNKLLEDIINDLEYVSKYITQYEKHYLFGTISNIITEVCNDTETIPFKFYIIFLESKAYKLSPKDKISIEWFKFILDVAFAKNKIAWVKTFKINYQRQLTKENSIAMQVYYRINMNLYKKKYDTIEYDLSIMPQPYLGLKIDYYLLMIRLKYEIREFSNARKYNNLFKRFIVNNSKSFSISKHKDYMIVTEIIKNLIDLTETKSDRTVKNIKNLLKNKLDFRYSWAIYKAKKLVEMK